MHRSERRRHDCHAKSLICASCSRGFFVYNGNRSDDDATQLKQFAKDLKKIDFSSDGSRRLWSDWYWSSNKREYSCMNTFEGDLLVG